MEEGKGLIGKDELLPQETIREMKAPVPISTVQSRMEELIPFAGTIEITEEQRKILFAPVDPESVEIRPDGLVYLPWMAYVERLSRAFGIAWCIIPKDMPKIQGNHMYWPFYLMIQGKLAGFAIGEQEYQPNNPQMSYSDASEGAKSNALMRLCKGIGISLELWKPSFIRAWKAKYAESFLAVWPDNKPKLDKNGKQKTEWRRKDRKNGEAIEPMEEVVDALSPTPSASPEDMEEFAKESKKKCSTYHDEMVKIDNIPHLKNYWQKYQIEFKKLLLPEHYVILEQLKDDLKVKLQKPKEV
ncbi:MAG: hypothetical protein DDT33_01592 [Firmicutes bacterium]|nr:hypothetical protein [Bacillota bacterium]